MRHAFRVRCDSEGRSGFTLIELLLVITIIAILAGLVLGTSSYVRRKGAVSRAEAEIKAIEAAAEAYRADNGIYPQNNATNQLNPREVYDPAQYSTASLYLYQELSGARTSPFRQKDSNAVQYMTFSPSMLPPLGSTAPVTHLRDPFGNSYGYSTARQFNPTFDLWSTGGAPRSTAILTPEELEKIRAQWIKNW